MYLQTRTRAAMMLDVEATLQLVLIPLNIVGHAISGSSSSTKGEKGAPTAPARRRTGAKLSGLPAWHRKAGTARNIWNLDAKGKGGQSAQDALFVAVGGSQGLAMSQPRGAPKSAVDRVGGSAEAP